MSFDTPEAVALGILCVILVGLLFLMLDDNPGPWDE